VMFLSLLEAMYVRMYVSLGFERFPGESSE
jgi:hypothetical protein